MKRKQHSEYLEYWIKSMEYGLLGGRPYSNNCICSYTYYVQYFLKTYKAVSADNLKLVLFSIPVIHFAKRIKIYEALNCFARFLILEGQLKKGYIETVKQFKPKRHLPPKKITVDRKGIEALITVSENVKDRLIIILLSQTGLRASEACGLKMSDINLEQRFLKVRYAKWGKTRRVGLTEKLVDAISNYLQIHQQAQDDFLLLDRNFRPMVRNGLLQRVQRLGHQAGIAVNPHALRRAFVTINANMGKPLVMLQIACGHNDIATTRSYCMTTEDEVVEAMAGWQW